MRAWALYVARGPANTSVGSPAQTRNSGFACERHTSPGTGPQRRPPRPQHPVVGVFAEVVCAVGATPPRTATSPLPTAASPPPNGGNCTIRAATRRRHADRMLLMVQTPTITPGVMLPHGLNAPDQVQSSRWGASCLRSGGASVLARRHRPRRRLGLSRDRHVMPIIAVPYAHEVACFRCAGPGRASRPRRGVSVGGQRPGEGAPASLRGLRKRRAARLCPGLECSRGGRDR